MQNQDSNPSKMMPESEFKTMMQVNPDVQAYEERN